MPLAQVRYEYTKQSAKQAIPKITFLRLSCSGEKKKGVNLDSYHYEYVLLVIYHCLKTTFHRLSHVMEPCPNDTVVCVEPVSLCYLATSCLP